MDRSAGRAGGGGLRVAVTGSSGLIGTALVAALRRAGHRVTRVVRPGSAGGGRGALVWDPPAGRIDAAGLDAHDAVFHLAGENVGGLWTAARRARIRDSRVRGTALLARTLAGLSKPPRVLLCASGINYYGNRPPDEAVDESALPGEGFLARVVVEWEQAAGPAREAGIRVVHMRSGPVLSPRGGALARMLPVFRLGMGGRFGSGRQVWSWIALDDAVGAALHALAHETLSGAVNFVAPEPVDNAEFTRTLARVLRRPAVFRVPAFALRLVLGQMADEALLSGVRAQPRRLLDSGYVFAYPELEPALRHVLGRAR